MVHKQSYFWLHKTRQDTFYFTSSMDFISFHDLHVSISIFLFYYRLYDQFQFIHTFICLLHAFSNFILYTFYTFICSIQIFYMFYVLYNLIYMITFISTTHLYIFYMSYFIQNLPCSLNLIN